MRRWIRILAILPLVTLAGCDFLGFKEWRWHQRLMLEVETPRGVVTGGSVVAIYVGSSPKWAPGMGAGGMGGKVDAGEASFVEVAPGRYLFALLGEDMEDLAFDVFFDRKGKDQKEIADQIELLRATREVPRENYPLLVTFEDINDPTTVKRVDPDYLAASFGPGVSLKRITLTLTDGPVTEGVINTLDWVEGTRIDPARNEGRSDTLRYPNDSPRGYGTLSLSEFIRRR
ncbi:MAG: hypothetical protein JJ864_16115 [Rhizobiaceae bacterium]|nr:hypothetical protein [Rhizobiaceae bacterium]